MPIWEYRIVRLGSLSEQEEALNSLGADRWEVVSIVAEGSESRAYLKRESVFSMSAMPPMPPPEMFGERPPAMTRSSVPVMQTHATLRLSAKDDPGVVGWLDSGLDLDEECAGISIAIDGEVLVSSGEAVDSEGSPTSMALNPAIGEELPKGCIVVKIGEHGAVEPVHFSGFLASEDKGRLYVTINDDSYENNDGEYTVIVSVL